MNKWLLINAILSVLVLTGSAHAAASLTVVNNSAVNLEFSQDQSQDYFGDYFIAEDTVVPVGAAGSVGSIAPNSSTVLLQGESWTDLTGGANSPGFREMAIIVYESEDKNYQLQLMINPTNSGYLSIALSSSGSPALSLTVSGSSSCGLVNNTPNLYQCQLIKDPGSDLLVTIS